MKIFRRENIKLVFPKGWRYSSFSIEDVRDKTIILEADGYNFENIIRNEFLKFRVTEKLPEDSKLYFSKNSEFPRFKLSNTSFKRKLQESTADYVVIKDGKYSGDNFCDSTIIESDEGIYIVPKCYNILKAASYINDPHPGNYYSDNEKECLKSVAEEGVIRLLKNLKINITNPRILYININIVMLNKDELVEKLIEGTFNKPIITDNDLDKQINSKLDVLDEDAVDSLYDMLTSSDFSNRSVGLKLLCGFNVEETPMTVRILLSLRSKTPYMCNEYNSVGVSQVIKSVSLRNKPYNSSIEGNIIGTNCVRLCINKNEQLNELDIALSRKILKKELYTYLNKVTDPSVILGNEGNDVFKFKINLSIE